MALSIRQVPAQKQELRLNAQLLQSLRILHLPQPKLEAFIEQQAQENPFLKVEKRGTLKEYQVSSLANPLGGGSLAEAGQSDGTDLLASSSSFRTQLLDQIAELSYSDSRERAMVQLLIESLDPSDGYLRTELSELAVDYNLDEEELEDALILLQDEIEPAGIGARTLRECFELQARRFHESKPHLLHMIQDYMELAQAGKADTLAETMNISEEEATDLIALFRSLDASPGRDLSPSPPTVSPDFEISKGEDNDLIIRSLRADSFHVTIPDESKELLEQTSDDQKLKQLRAKLATAHALKSAVERRIETERAVIESIVRVQRNFFLDGYQGLRPLTQREVAEAIGMHESTISRVVAGRYILTPQQQTHELREFFSRALPTESGEAASSIAVKVMIRKIVDNEEPTGPLSDNRIAEMLLDKYGVHIARRTVAKYRKTLDIPTSSQRRRRH